MKKFIVIYMDYGGQMHSVERTAYNTIEAERGIYNCREVKHVIPCNVEKEENHEHITKGLGAAYASV